MARDIEIMFEVIIMKKNHKARAQERYQICK